MIVRSYSSWRGIEHKIDKKKGIVERVDPAKDGHWIVKYTMHIEKQPD